MIYDTLAAEARKDDGLDDSHLAADDKIKDAAILSRIDRVIT
jgi:hypothetical protein